MNWSEKHLINKIFSNNPELKQLNHEAWVLDINADKYTYEVWLNKHAELDKKFDALYTKLKANEGVKK